MPVRSLRVLALLLVAACGSRDATARRATVDTLPGGIVRVRNAAPSAWPDTSGWRLVEERVIDPPEGSPGELGEIAGVVANAAGTVVVSMDSPVSLTLFGPDGAYLRTLGRVGDGPGEYRSGPIGIRGDTVVVQDPSNARMTLFHVDGTSLGSHPTHCCFYARTLDVDDAGLVAIPGPTAADGQAWHRYDLSGTLHDTIVRPAEPEGLREWRVPVGKTAMRLTIPLQAELVAHQRPDGLLVLGITDRPRFVLSRTGRDTVRIIEMPAVDVALRPGERDSVMNAALRWAEDTAAFRRVAKASDIPDRWPPWSQFAIDGANRLWVGVPGTRGAVSTLQVFDRDGRLLGSVPTPDPYILKGFWTADRVYLRSQADDGRPVVRIFRLDTLPRGPR